METLQSKKVIKLIVILFIPAIFFLFGFFVNELILDNVGHLKEPESVNVSDDKYADPKNTYLLPKSYADDFLIQAKNEIDEKCPNETIKNNPEEYSVCLQGILESKSVLIASFVANIKENSKIINNELVSEGIYLKNENNPHLALENNLHNNDLWGIGYTGNNTSSTAWD